MKVQFFADWRVFNLGFVISPRTGLFVGFGPVLFRVLWGPSFFRCEECGKKQFDR
jgi:hypothetical protein